MGPLRVGAVALIAGFAVALLASAPAQAADPVFGRPTIEGTFGEGLEVTQPVTLDEIPARVELLLTWADTSGSEVVELPSPASTGAQTLRHMVGVAADGHILPNTPVTARWRLTGDDGSTTIGPAVDTVYADDRFDWQTVAGDVVRVHWYEGGTEFGERALRIGEKAVAESAALLGVTEDQPVDFFIYADQGEFYDALGPGTRENVGGQANSEIRTLFALISPREIDDPWVDVVVPHELVHLVFATAVDNPYHFPPRWLNEGLAVYLSEGYGPSDRASVERAARDGDLIPLDGLGGAFPTGQGFAFAYAESVSAVDFFVRTHGQDALVQLIRSYADGRTDDEAFEAAIGQDLAEFGGAWLADLGATAPVRHGPQPAPSGPAPAAWDGAPGKPGPGTSPEPGAATERPTAPAAPGGVVTSRTGGSTGVLVIVGVIVGLLVVALVWTRRRGAARGRLDPAP